jgi:hypothetical protein
LARPPQEPTYVLGTSKVMWKTLFIVFYHNNYFSSNNIQFYSLKYIIFFILGIISYTVVSRISCVTISWSRPVFSRRPREHKKKITQGTSTLIYRQGKRVAKKIWPFIPCRLPPSPLVVAGGTDTGTILAFIGG